MRKLLSQCIFILIVLILSQNSNAAIKLVSSDAVLYSDALLFEELFNVPYLLNKKLYGQKIVLTDLNDQNIIIRDIERHMKGILKDLLNEISMLDLKCQYSADIPAENNRPRTMYLEWKQFYEQREIKGARVRAIIKVLEKQSIILSLEINILDEKGLKQLKTEDMDLEYLRKKSARVLGVEEHAVIHSQRRFFQYINENWEAVVEFVFEQKPEWTMVIFNDQVYFKDNRQYVFQPQISPNGVYGIIKGRGVRFDPRATGTNLDILALSDLEVVLNAQKIFTESDGSFAFNGIRTGVLLTSLKGRWAQVTNFLGSNLSFTANVKANAPVSILFNSQGNNLSATEQVNGYYHATQAHNWIKARLISSTALDLAIPVHINDTQSCAGACYTSSTRSIHFGPGYAYDTIVSHEYGHFVDDTFGGITNSDLSEGWADLLAAYISQQPLIAENEPWGHSVDGNAQYPFDGQNQYLFHLQSTFSGFAWDLRKILQNIFGPAGIAMAERIVVPALIINSPHIPQAIWDIVLLDDDDGNLGNATPNFNYIAAAAQAHNLYPFIDLILVNITAPSSNQTISKAQTSQVSIIGTAQSPVGIPFQDYQLFYGSGSMPTLWIAISAPVSYPINNGILAAWDISSLPGGTYTIKLVVRSVYPAVQYHYGTTVQVN